MSQDGLPLLAGAQQVHPTIFVFTGGGFNSPMFEALRAIMGNGHLQAVPAPGSTGGGGAAGTPDEAQRMRREPLPRGEAERRVLLLLEKNPDAEYTPGQVAQAIDARGCRDLMGRLLARGIVEITNEHPLTYRAARPKQRRAPRSRGGKNKQ